MDVTCVPVSFSYALVARTDRPLHKPYLLDVARKAGFTEDTRSRDCGLTSAEERGARLPTDLFSPDGGAAELGGVQDPTTGAVHVYSDSLLFHELSEMEVAEESGTTNLEQDGSAGPGSGVDSTVPGSVSALPTHNIAFKVVQPSILRVYASADTPGYSFKLIVYDSEAQDGEQQKVLAGMWCFA